MTESQVISLTLALKKARVVGCAGQSLSGLASEVNPDDC